MFLKNFILGIIIGIGFIIPGVSGGVLATMLGVYDKIIFSICNLFHDFKTNFKYLLPILLGSLLSIFGFSKIILYLLSLQEDFISWVFIGLIIGSLPYLVKEIKVKTNQNISLPIFILTFLIGLSLLIFERYLFINSSPDNQFLMIIGGLFYAIGKIVPGISGASLLMFLGIYEYLLNIIAHPSIIDIKIILNLIPFIISFIISAFIILKITSNLLSKYFRLTYSAIIGFVLSSILFIIPTNFNFESFIIIILSFLISYNLSH